MAINSRIFCHNKRLWLHALYWNNEMELESLRDHEEFRKCHVENPIAKFFGECTDLKIKLDRCFGAEKAVKRKANFEKTNELKEQLQLSGKKMLQATVNRMFM
ncbi:COX assembly mitochondrial protein [Trifolium repens]|nr:COX assembly mitochondrial protein [Trifolium repens]